MEELCAELYGEHGPEMELLVNKILNYYLRWLYELFLNYTYSYSNTLVDLILD
jgi:hypothetical protein